MTKRQEILKQHYCFPAMNLIELWPPNTHATKMADVFGVSRSTISAWRNEPRQLTIWQADKYAIKVGMHPSEIWTDWYDKQ